jgi:hypothetical protein
MRFWILLWLVCGLSHATSVGGRSPRVAGDTSPTLYYDAARHSLVVGPVERGGDLIEVLNVIGQRVATFTLHESGQEGGRLVSLSLPSLSPGLYYARWLQNGQVYQVRRFSVT